MAGKKPPTSQNDNDIRLALPKYLDESPLHCLHNEEHGNTKLTDRPVSARVVFEAETEALAAEVF